MELINITDYRSKHVVLVKPMTEKELKENVRKDGSIQAKIRVSFNDLLENDLEWFNDYAAESVTNSVVGLTDINYSVAGRTTNDEVIIKVTASVEFDNL